MYLLLKTDSLGISTQKGALLFSCINIMSTISRVVTGWVTSMDFANSIIISSTGMTVAGVATVLCAFSSTYSLLVMYAVVYGISIAAFISLQSIIIVDLVGLDMLTNAFGLLCLFKGVACYCGPPLAGLVSDALEDYNGAFFLAGGLLTLGGLLSFSLRPLSAWHSRRIQDQDLSSSKLTIGTLRILGTLRPQANVLGISEQHGAPEVLCAGPTNVSTRPDLHHSNPQLWTTGRLLHKIEVEAAHSQRKEPD
ncbi:hypothetical protein NP493_350g01027 [Ridgeia piscesae]|uniref:Monocarboxylate transporter n=1 Tax=Ridgeia piscesae TaxID=27915 RepID=A0AAD9L470_RIDPI|nr:hypothetical protein NP493_350g01027 [Ridgeia piscesae]